MGKWRRWGWGNGGSGSGGVGGRKSKIFNNYIVFENIYVFLYFFIRIKLKKICINVKD